MKEAKLKSWIGLFFIICHLVVIIPLIVGFWLSNWFTSEEMTTTIALIMPMFSIYTTAIIKYIMSSDKAKKNGRGSKQVDADKVFITFLLPFLFVAFVILIIVLAGLNVLPSFEIFKSMLAIAETVYGVYAALVLTSLFEIESSAPRKRSEKAGDL